MERQKMKEMLHRFLELVGGYAMAISMFKAESLGLMEDIVSSGVAADEYPACSGERACGLRTCNFIESRRNILLWDLHGKAFRDVPVRLLLAGAHQPTGPILHAAKNTIPFD